MTQPRTAPVDPSFDLVDHEGRCVRPADFGGKYMLVFFGFTHCRVVCPRELGKLSSALERIGPKADCVQPLYISVDPERDTPEVMKAFLLGKFPRFLGLTGSREQTESAKYAFRVFARRRDDASAPGGYDVPHTAVAYLLGPDGRYLAHFANVLTDEQVAAQLSELIV